MELTNAGGVLTSCFAVAYWHSLGWKDPPGSDFSVMAACEPPVVPVTAASKKAVAAPIL